VFLTHDDGSGFSDGSRYQQDAVKARLEAGAALYATTVTIRMITSVMPEPGQHFSIGHRLYRITRILSQVDEVASLKVWPPLREAVTAGDDADFSNPVCKMRLSSDTEMAAGELAANRFGVAAVAFIEDTF
jgi:hypothetical protein